MENGIHICPIWLATIIGFKPISHLHHIQLSGQRISLESQNYLQFLGAVSRWSVCVCVCKHTYHNGTPTEIQIQKKYHQTNIEWAMYESVNRWTRWYESLAKWRTKTQWRIESYCCLLYVFNSSIDDSLLRPSTMVAMHVVWLEIEWGKYGFWLW